jgi:hypothetical protein
MTARALSLVIPTVSAPVRGSDEEQAAASSRTAAQSVERDTVVLRDKGSWYRDSQPAAPGET